ncbi:uncharacterized protein LOC108905673 [Anoplophora glabripennis]|uniref:uncharacterized protein LOC108905673 n=1 Tax=Anoplophora glabripennis TaxID=217634 RepID=UPI000874FCB7|nr:uncharacterized protein LOC108905673 [Anoplophora glabripennis]
MSLIRNSLFFLFFVWNCGVLFAKKDTFGAIFNPFEVKEIFPSFGLTKSAEKSHDRQSLLDKLFDRFKKGEYTFRVGQVFRVYNSSGTNVHNMYKADLLELDGYSDCIGFTTERFETIVLQCSEKDPDEPSCYEVLVPKSKQGSNDVLYEKQEKRICPRKLTKACVGITTRDNTTVMLACNAYTGNIARASNNAPPPVLQ